MKANELRIGNLVMIDGSIIKTSSGVIYNCVRNENCYKPIPLTEEWLLKFGFKYDDQEKEFLGLPVLSITFYSDCSNNFSTVEFNVRNSRVKIKYVHQLQNLYWCLTNKELILK